MAIISVAPTEPRARINSQAKLEAKATALMKIRRLRQSSGGFR
jgi:hypothetical protein